MPTSVDTFDRLPDSLLLHILNDLRDIKALGRCSAVSKRFHGLVPLVDNILVKVDCVISADDHTSLSLKGKGFFSLFFKFLLGSLLKPLHALHHYLAPKRNLLAEVSHHSPGEVLKNFKSVRHLKIELPGGELGVEDGVLLKWRAEFGSTLESCVILGASSLLNFDKQVAGKSSIGYLRRIEDVSTAEIEEDAATLTASQEDTGSIPESFYTNGGLKLRVVWTISSLIAASARHYLLQQIICDHPTLESLILADADGQGTLCMGKRQLRDFRDKPIATSAAFNRTQVPALNMKLWYAPLLDLPGGSGMKGATLVSIRPSDQSLIKETDNVVSSVFEEPFKSAASSLVKRRTYVLEMNSF